MHDPVPGLRAPVACLLAAGERRAWCACGRSASAPFCDGSHAGTTTRPFQYVAPRTAWVWFCGCGRSADPPFCDGSHRRAP